MLLCNLNQSDGLCNGSRLIVTQLGEKVIQARLITGTHVGNDVFIPRITLTLKCNKWPFILERRQFPIKVCYAMTINKSQGQTLSSFGVYLRRPIFSHGHLYVAISRVTSREGLKLLIEDEDGKCVDETRNVVYNEVFTAFMSLQSTPLHSLCFTMSALFHDVSSTSISAMVCFFILVIVVLPFPLLFFVCLTVTLWPLVYLSYIFAVYLPCSSSFLYCFMLCTC